MKKIICILLSLVLVLSVCGCSEQKNKDKKDNTSNDSAKDNTSSVFNSYVDPDGVSFAIFTDAHIGASEYHKTRLMSAIEWVNAAEEVDFAVFLGDNTHSGYAETDLAKEQVAKFKEITSGFEKPYYYLRGNHDEAVEEFPEHFVAECGDVAFIAFYSKIMWRNEKPNASGWGVPAEDLKWLEETLEKCRGKRVIFGCHLGIVQDNPNFNTWLESKAVDEKTGEVLLDFGREKILELAEKYNVELYFNGHEHNRDVPNGVAGTMIDFNLGSIGCDGVFAVVTVKADRAIIQIRNTGINGLVKKIDYQFRFDIVK